MRRSSSANHLLEIGPNAVCWRVFGLFAIRRDSLHERVARMIQHNEALTWVEEMAALCRPDEVVWCDGSEQEKQRLTEEAIATGEIHLLDQEKLPGCVMHRTAENDVARTEHLTFICTSKEEDRRPHQQLDGPIGSVFQGRRDVRWVHAGPDDVCCPVHHGGPRLTVS